jgi:ribosome-associated protein
VFLEGKTLILEPEALLDKAVTKLDDLKAVDIKVVDVRGKTPLTDYLIIASGTSTRHLKALANGVGMMAKEVDHDTVNIEGDGDSEWVLVDLADVIVHLFLPRTREFYNLEKLWMLDAPASSDVQHGA